MTSVPFWLIAAFTFPGAIVHQIVERLCVDLAGIPVYAVRYFRLGDPYGYVVHGPVTTLKQALLIALGPLVVCTLLCAALTFTAVSTIFLDVRGTASNWFILQGWFGLSMGIHAFPNKLALNDLVRQIRQAEQTGARPVGAKFLASCFSLARALRVLWVDAIYAAGVSVALPALLRLMQMKH